jgi:tetratricopeptide (TPR) repeat protein
MTCEQCNEWLGDAVDGRLDTAQQAAVDAHCRGCAACRELLDDLKEIRATASTLDRRTPSPELWRAIAAKVEPASPKRPAYAPLWRDGLAWPLAAAAALVMMLGAAAWFTVGNQFRGGGRDAASDLARSAASELQLAEQHYENAIAALEQLTVKHDNALDPSVAAEIAESLKSIDRAIDDSRAALKSDPNSFVAQTSLLEALRMKVALLQETVSLMNAS